MEDSALIQDAVHALEAHPNSLKIRKLLFYICKSRWENDPQQLQTASLSELVTDILQIALSLDTLKRILEENTKTLNKRAEYTLIANVIFQNLRKLYSTPNPSLKSNTTSSSFAKVSQALEQEANSNRAKKLLLYACRNIWENDPAQLEQIAFSSLLPEIREITNTLEDLELILGSIVNSLNRRTEYALVADTIIQHSRLLYEEAQPATQLMFNSENDTTEIVSNQSCNTAIAQEPLTELDRDRSLFDNPYSQIARQLEQDQANLLRIQKLLFCACNNYWENDPQKLAIAPLSSLLQTLHSLSPSLVDLQSQLQAIVNTLNHQAVYSFIVSEIVQACIGLYPVAPISNQLTKRTYQAFDLRLEVMKYTNPLRAKILIFSVLYHQFLFDDRDWFALKNHDLDTLLKNLFDQCETLSALTARLEITASCLPDSEEYNQAAGAIFQCLKPFYPTIEQAEALPFGQPQAIANQNPDQTSISHFAEATQLNPAVFLNKNEEHTCQFFSPPSSATELLESPAIAPSHRTVVDNAATPLETELLEPSQVGKPAIS